MVIKNKYTVFSIVFLLTSCENYDTVYVHEKAKEHPNQHVCYTLEYPEDLAGRYCLKYEN